MTTALPLDRLIEGCVEDGSSTYNDGDYPGYYWATWDQDSGVLTFHFQADIQYCDHGDTRRRFRLIEEEDA